jgi:hypothetical protein
MSAADATPARDATRATADILAREIYVAGANRRFGELTAAHVRERADELRAAAGWGPTIRVAPVAQAWRELALALERSRGLTVAELEPDVVAGLAERLWVVMPSGPLMS